MPAVQVGVESLGKTSKRAFAGWVFSAMPPMTSDRATMVTRTNLKKIAALRYFPKFLILIYLPPFFSHRMDLFFIWSAKWKPSAKIGWGFDNTATVYRRTAI